MKDKPWIVEDDPLKTSYDLLDELELEDFKNLYKQSNEQNISNDTVLLLDFYNRFNEFNEYALFEQLCSIVGDGEYLYWIPLHENALSFELPVSKDDLSFWGNYSPIMIAKTKAESNVISKVGSSFMQMINGGYMVFDSESRFWGVVIDGYYMLIYIKKEFLSAISTEFITNWGYINENLDPILIDDLFKRTKIVNLKSEN